MPDGVLERLDRLSGRVPDDCNFFALDELRDLGEEALDDRLLEGLADWRKAAKEQRIIR